jgi:hypothetical protein
MRTVAAEHPAAVSIELNQGMAMVPMTDELFDAVRADILTNRELGFDKLPAGFEQKLAAWSKEGPIGYIEADYFGGVGSQRAALWRNGALTLGPLKVDEQEPFPDDGSPISQLLRHLGVRREFDYDEFDAVGLDRHRDTEDWLP